MSLKKILKKKKKRIYKKKKKKKIKKKKKNLLKLNFKKISFFLYIDISLIFNFHLYNYFM